MHQIARRSATPQALESLFHHDPKALGAFLWTALEQKSLDLTVEPAFALYLSQAEQYSDAQVLAYLRQLAASPKAKRWLALPQRRTDDQAYGGWHLALEQMLASLSDRSALIENWETLPDPLGLCVAFALVRRGDLPKEVLPPYAITYFAIAYASTYDWKGCAAQFEGIERAFSGASWLKALLEACLSRRVRAVGLWPRHLEPLVPLASPDQLLQISEKLAWLDLHLVDVLLSKGPAMQQALEQRLGRVLTRTGRRRFWLFMHEELWLTAYAKLLRAKGVPLSPKYHFLLQRLFRSPNECLPIVLSTVPLGKREELLLSWAKRVSTFASELDALRYHPTPRIASFLIERIVEGRDKTFAAELALPTLGQVGAQAVCEAIQAPCAIAPNRVQTLLETLRVNPCPGAPERLLALLNDAEEPLHQDLERTLEQQPSDALFAALEPALGLSTRPIQWTAARLLAGRHALEKARALATHLAPANGALGAWVAFAQRPMEAPLQVLLEHRLSDQERLEALHRPLELLLRPQALTRLPEELRAQGPSALCEVLLWCVEKARWRQISIWLPALWRLYEPQPAAAWAAVLWCWDGDEPLVLQHAAQVFGPRLREPLERRLEARALSDRGRQSVMTLLGQL